MNCDFHLTKARILAALQRLSSYKKKLKRLSTASPTSIYFRFTCNVKQSNFRSRSTWWGRTLRNKQHAEDAPRTVKKNSHFLTVTAPQESFVPSQRGSELSALWWPRGCAALARCRSSTETTRRAPQQPRAAPHSEACAEKAPRRAAEASGLVVDHCMGKPERSFIAWILITQTHKQK